MNIKAVSTNSFVLVSTIIFIIIIILFLFSSGKTFGERSPQQEARVLCVSSAVDYSVSEIKIDQGKLKMTIANTGRVDIDEFYVQAFFEKSGKTFRLEGAPAGLVLDYSMNLTGVRPDMVKVFPTIMFEGLDRPFACVNIAREKRI